MKTNINFRYAFAGVLAVGIYFWYTGYSEYRDDRASFWSNFVAAQPNWNLVKGYFFVGIAVGFFIGELISYFRKNPNLEQQRQSGV